VKNSNEELFSTLNKVFWLHEVCFVYGFFVYDIPLCSFGSFFIIVYTVVRYVHSCLILQIMYSYCHVYVPLLVCMLYSVHSVFIVPTATRRLP
jgi:hypothetical protein